MNTLDMVWAIRNIDDDRIRGSHKAILYALVAFRKRLKDGSFVIAPSIEQIASGAGITRATVIREVPKLLEIGVVTRTRTSRRQVATYTLHLSEWSHPATSQGEPSVVAPCDHSVVASTPPSGRRMSHSEDLGSEDLKTGTRIPLTPKGKTGVVGVRGQEINPTVSALHAFWLRLEKKRNPRQPDEKPSRGDIRVLETCLARGLSVTQIASAIFGGVEVQPFIDTNGDMHRRLRHVLSENRIAANIGKVGSQWTASIVDGAIAWTELEDRAAGGAR